MPERELVFVSGEREYKIGRMAQTLQRGAPAQRIGRQNISGIRQAVSIGEEPASPSISSIRQVATRLKGSLRRPGPPLTRAATCQNMTYMRAKRSYESPRLETLY